LIGKMQNVPRSGGRIWSWKEVKNLSPKLEARRDASLQKQMGFGDGKFQTAAFNEVPPELRSPNAGQMH